MNVLIVVDCQNDFIDGSLGTPEAVAIVPKVVDKIRSFDGAVIATLDTHCEDYLNTQEGNFLPIEHCIQNTPGHKIHSDILNALSEKYQLTSIQKNTFGSTELLDEMGTYTWFRNGLDMDITFVGLCTDICVISNALLVKARFPEAHLYVAADCCAGTTPAKHKAALEVLESCQVTVI